MTSPKVSLSAAVLKWARVTRFSADLDVAASKLKVKKEDILLWETNGAEMSAPMIRRLSRVYKRPMPVFLLKTAPKNQQPPKFRRFIIESSILSKETLMIIRKAQELQVGAIDLMGNSKNSLLNKLDSYKGDSSSLAEKAIQLMGIGKETRFSSKNTKEQLQKWKRILEGNNIMVLEHSFPLSDSRAFVIYNKSIPVIVLNSRDSDNGRVFSLFHEFGHLLLKQSEFDVNITLDYRHMIADELFCNQLSANILVPVEELQRRIPVGLDIDETQVKDLADEFKVSMSVIWRRLYDNRFIPSTQYNRIRSRLSIFESFKLEKKKKKFGANKNTHLYKKIKNMGELYIGATLEAFNDNRISHYEVLDYLGIKSSALPRLQNMMFL